MSKPTTPIRERDRNSGEEELNRKTRVLICACIIGVVALFFAAPIVNFVSVGHFEGLTQCGFQGLVPENCSGAFVSENTYVTVYQSLGCRIAGLGDTYAPGISGLRLGCAVPVQPPSGLAGMSNPVPPLNQSILY